MIARPSSFTLSPILAALICTSLTVHAQDAAKPTVPTLGQVLDASGITMTGHIDAAYSHADRTPTLRAFDTERNSFNLHQAALTVSKQPKEGVGALVNLTAGEDASVIASSGLSANTLDLTQAFIQYATGPLTVLGGKFTTLAGAEVIASPGNANYSRSILFGSVPFTHTGLRANYALSDGFTVIGGVNNGWDQVKDANHQKTLELGVLMTPMPGTSVALSNYLGTENTSATTHGTRHLLNAVATFSASDALSFGAEALYFSQKNFASLVNSQSITAKAYGLAGYAGMQLGGDWKLSARAEWYKDKDGFRSGVADNKLSEFTATVAFAAVQNMEVRGEMRYDRASKATFADSNGSLGKNLFTYAMQFLYKF